jgi:hypothetical protein
MLDLFLMLGQADGRRLADLLLDRCPACDRYRVDVQISAGALAWWTGDAEGARRSLAAGRRLATDLDERALEGWGRIFERLVDLFGGSVERARHQFQEAQRLHRELEVRSGEARSTSAIGPTHMLEGDSGRAKHLVEEGLDIVLEAGDRFTHGQSHTYLGLIAQSTGDERAAPFHYRAAVDCLRLHRDATLLPMTLVGQAGVLVRRDPAATVRVTAAASSLRAHIGGEFPPLVRARVDQVRSVAEATLGNEADRC